MTSLLTFLASDFFHVGRFLLVNITPQTQNKSAGKKPRWGSCGWGDGCRYRTIPGTVALCITVATQEFGFLRTICTEVPSLLATATSDRGQKFFGEGFIAFFGGMSFLSVHMSAHCQIEVGEPAVATAVVPGRTIAGHMTSFTTRQLYQRRGGVLAITTDHAAAEILSLLGAITHAMSLLSAIDTADNGSSANTFYNQHHSKRQQIKERWRGGMGPSGGLVHSLLPCPLVLQLKQMGMRSSTRKPALASLSRFSSAVEATCPLVALNVIDVKRKEGGEEERTTECDDFWLRVGMRRGILSQCLLGGCGWSFVGEYPFATKSDPNRK